MLGIDLSTTLFIYPIVVLNTQLLEDEPPFIGIDFDQPSMKDFYKSWLLREGRRYDYYQDVRVISILQAGQCVHYVLSNDYPGLTQVRDNCARIGVSSELEVLAGVFNRLTNVDGQYPLVGRVAGWGIRKYWPLLVNRAFRYNIRIADPYKTDPMQRYNTTDTLMELTSIYTQNVYGRTVPDMSEAFKLWTIQWGGGAHPTDDEIRKMSDKELVSEGLTVIETRLRGMYELAQRYYDYEDNGYT